MMITAGRQEEQLCWPEPWTRFSARTRPSALSGSGSTQISQPATLSEQLTPIRVTKEGRPLVFERTEHGSDVPYCRLASADMFAPRDNNARDAPAGAEPEYAH